MELGWVTGARSHTTDACSRVARRWRDASLTVKHTIALGALFAIAVIAIWSSVLLAGRQIAYARGADRLLAVCSERADMVEMCVEAAQSLARSLCARQQLAETLESGLLRPLTDLERAQLAANLAYVRRALPQITYIELLDAAGRTVVRLPDVPVARPPDRALIERARYSHVVELLHIQEGQHTLDLAGPVHLAGRPYVGVLAIRLDEFLIHNLGDAPRGLGKGADGRVWMAWRSGLSLRILSGPEERPVPPAVRSMLECALQGAPAEDRLIDDAGGRRMAACGGARLGGTLAICADVAEEDVLRPGWQAARYAEISGSVVLLLGLALLGPLQGWLTRPLVRLAQTARRVAGGELTARSGLSGGDEMGQLGEALDAMASSLAQQIAYRDSASAELVLARKRAESHVRALEEANRELEAFSYSVSHDLRAPLRHVTAFSDLLAQQASEVLDESSRHYVEVIRSSSVRMARLIDALLGLSRASRAPMRMTRVNLRGLVDDVFAELAPERRGRSIRWTIADLPDVQGDRTLLRVVFSNLIGNALKYTRPRGDATEIDVEFAYASAGTVEIRVRDNGVGFDPEYADKLFGVFQRLHSDAEFEGTGIGLANVRRLVMRHGGRTWADGRPGEGATFHVTLPVAGDAA